MGSNKSSLTVRGLSILIVCLLMLCPNSTMKFSFVSHDPLLFPLRTFGLNPLPGFSEGLLHCRITSVFLTHLKSVHFLSRSFINTPTYHETPFTPHVIVTTHTSCLSGSHLLFARSSPWWDINFLIPDVEIPVLLVINWFHNFNELA